MNRPRDARGAYSETSVDATGNSPPRPRPAITRARSSVSKLGAIAERSAPTEKSTSVTWNTDFRPTRSASRPATAAPRNIPTNPALATKPVCVASRPNSVRIGVSRNAMRITSIASNIQPRPATISRRQ